MSGTYFSMSSVSVGNTFIWFLCSICVAELDWFSGAEQRLTWTCGSWRFNPLCCFSILVCYLVFILGTGEFCRH